MINQELYIPESVKIISVRNESDLVKTYKLKLNEKFRPGQFFQVSVLGVGEVPISISSSPAEKGFIELTVRNTGKVTGAIHKLTKNDIVGLRGPYGNFFPIQDSENRDLIFVSGGIGLAPLRSLIRYILANRKRYGHIYLLYGARIPNEMIFRNELDEWQGLENFDVLLTVDKAENGWKGKVGVVTTLFNNLNLNSNLACRQTGNYIAFVCGPAIMIKYTIHKLLQLGLKENNIFVTLERYMKCGVGKCGHCYIADKYVCIDGPVFTFQQLKEMKPEEVIA